MNSSKEEKAGKTGAVSKQLFLDRVGRHFSKALNFVFVPKCVVCDDPLWGDGEMCPECLQLWERAKEAKCPVCRKTARKCTCGTQYLLSTQTVGDRYLCALAFYGKPDSTDMRDVLVRRITKHVKTHPDRRIIRFLARELAAEIIRHFAKSGESSGDWSISYPPRIKQRTREFGFDQGRELARETAKFTGIPCVELFRRRGDKLQKTLSSEDRKKNADESISLLHSDCSPYKKVIIVDDIITTGATVGACRNLIRENGTQAVFFACFARTKPQKLKVRRTPADKVWFLKRENR